VSDFLSDEVLLSVVQQKNFDKSKTFCCHPDTHEHLVLYGNIVTASRWRYSYGSEGELIPGRVLMPAADVHTLIVPC